MHHKFAFPISSFEVFSGQRLNLFLSEDLRIQVELSSWREMSRKLSFFFLDYLKRCQVPGWVVEYSNKENILFGYGRKFYKKTEFLELGSENRRLYICDRPHIIKFLSFLKEKEVSGIIWLGHEGFVECNLELRSGDYYKVLPRIVPFSSMHVGEEKLLLSLSDGEDYRKIKKSFLGFLMDFSKKYQIRGIILRAWRDDIYMICSGFSHRKKDLSWGKCKNLKTFKKMVYDLFGETLLERVFGSLDKNLWDFILRNGG